MSNDIRLTFKGTREDAASDNTAVADEQGRPLDLRLSDLRGCKILTAFLDQDGCVQFTLSPR